MRRTTLTRRCAAASPRGEALRWEQRGGEQILDPFGLVGLIYSWLSTGNEAGVASFGPPLTRKQ